MSHSRPFPHPVRMRNRLYWRRLDLEAYKRHLVAAALGVTDPPFAAPSNVEEFVAAAMVAKELGFGRRTLGRLIADFTREGANAA
jgi:hypothetical protein